MNNKQKNRKNKTSQVYSLLPEYQYVTGMPQFNMGGQAYDYDHYMTNQLFKADDGEEIGTPNPMACPPGQEYNEELGACVLVEVEVNANKEGDKTNVDITDGKGVENQNTMMPPWMQNSYQIGPNPYGNYNYGDPYQDEHTEAVNSIMDNSLLGAAFMTANSLKGAGKRIKKAFANINPKTGRPYSHTDFGVSTITNTTDKNVLLNQEGLDNLYDKKGRIIDENNTADNLFISQNQAKADYFNQGADYHSSTFLDQDGNPLMSKQQMDADGNITYADIEEEVDVANPNFNPDLPEGPDNQMFVKQTQTRAHTDADLTLGDNVQEHIKDLNASRILFNDDNTEVTRFTRNNITDDGEDGQKTIEETIAYDPDADYTEGSTLEVINRQDILNKQKYGYELPKAQNGVNNMNALRLNAPAWDLSGRCYNDGCAKRYYDSPHDLSVGIGTGVGKIGEDYMGDATLWGGYSFNPQPGSGSFRGAQEGLAGYLGANIGGRMIMPKEVIQDGVGDADFETFANAVGTIGYKGEWKPNNDYTAFLTGRDKNPLQYGLGAFYKHPLMGGSPEVGGYANLGNLNFTAGYVPGTGMNYGVGLGIPIRKRGGDLRRFVYAQDGVETDKMAAMQDEFNRANVGHYVEPTNNTTDGLSYGNSRVASKNINSATNSTNNNESSYENDFIENRNISNAAGSDNVMVDRTWMGNLFNKSNVIPANINKKRHIKNITEKYGMTPEELLATGEWQLGPDGTMINTPYTSSHWAHSATKDNDMTFNEVFGTYTEPNEANNYQGGFSTSITKNKDMDYSNDADTYWKNIGQYSTGDDNIYSDPANRGSFLPEVTITGKYGGQLAYFQNGGAPQPSGRTYKIDGRVVTKEEYDNYIAQGGENGTTDDDNIAPPDNAPLVPPIVPQYGPQNAPVVIDQDEDNIPDTIDVDAGGGTNEPVEGVEPFSPTPDAPVEFAYTDKPELTEEQMAMMTEEQIEGYNKMRGKEEKWNKLRADYNTSALGKIEKGFTAAVGEGMKVVDFVNQVGNKAQLAVDEANADNANDEYSDFATAIEASRSAKGDFDVNSGVYRANTLGYGDGPRGQIAQMGAETGGRPAPNYAYLKEFLDAAIVSYDPSFLMAQARDGEEIEADMNLIKELMAAGADFEII